MTFGAPGSARQAITCDNASFYRGFPHQLILRGKK
jgi:hypothetical protein